MNAFICCILLTVSVLLFSFTSVAQASSVDVSIASSWQIGSQIAFRFQFDDELDPILTSAWFSFTNFPTMLPTICPMTADDINPTLNLKNYLQCYSYIDNFGNSQPNGALFQQYIGFLHFPSCTTAPSSLGHMELKFETAKYDANQIIVCLGRITPASTTTITLPLNLTSVSTVTDSKTPQKWDILPQEDPEESQHIFRQGLTTELDKMELKLSLNTTSTAQTSFESTQIFSSLQLDIKNTPINYLTELDIGYLSISDDMTPNDQNYKFVPNIFNDLMTVFQTRNLHEVFNWPFPFPIPTPSLMSNDSNSNARSNGLETQSAFNPSAFSHENSINLIQDDQIQYIYGRFAQSEIQQYTSLNNHHYEEFFTSLLNHVTLMFSQAQIHRTHRLNQQKLDNIDIGTDFDHLSNTNPITINQVNNLHYISTSIPNESTEDEFQNTLSMLGIEQEDLIEAYNNNLFPQLKTSNFQNKLYPTGSSSEIVSSSSNIPFSGFNMIPPFVSKGLGTIFSNFQDDLRNQQNSSFSPISSESNVLSNKTTMNNQNSTQTMNIQAPSPLPDFSRFNPNQFEFTKYRYAIQCGRQVRLYVTPTRVSDDKSHLGAAQYKLYLITGAHPIAHAKCTFPISLTRLFYQQFMSNTPFLDRPYDSAPTLHLHSTPAQNPPQPIAFLYQKPLSIGVFFKQSPQEKQLLVKTTIDSYDVDHPSISPSSHITSYPAKLTESTDKTQYIISQRIQGIGNRNNVLKLSWTEGIDASVLYDTYIDSWDCGVKNSPLDTQYTPVIPQRTTDGMDLELKNPTTYFDVYIQFFILKDKFGVSSAFIPFLINWELNKQSNLLSTPKFNGVLNTFPQFAIDSSKSRYLPADFTETSIKYQMNIFPTILATNYDTTNPEMINQYSKIVPFFQEFSLILDYYNQVGAEFRSLDDPYPNCTVDAVGKQDRTMRVSVHKLPTTSYSRADQYYLHIQGRFLVTDDITITCDQNTHPGPKQLLNDKSLTFHLLSRYHLDNTQHYALQTPAIELYEKVWNKMPVISSSDMKNGVYTVDVEVFREMTQFSIKNSTISRIKLQLSTVLQDEIDFDLDPILLHGQSTGVQQNWMQQVHSNDAKHMVSKLGRYGATMQLIFLAKNKKINFPSNDPNVFKPLRLISLTQDYVMSITYSSHHAEFYNCTAHWVDVNNSQDYIPGCPIPLGEPCYSSSQCAPPTAMVLNNDILPTTVCIAGICSIDQFSIGSTTFAHSLSYNSQSLQTSLIYPYFTSHTTNNPIVGFSMDNLVLFDDQGLDDDGKTLGDNIVTMQGQLNCSLGTCSDDILDIDVEFTLPCKITSLTTITANILTYTDVTSLTFEKTDLIKPILDTTTFQVIPSVPEDNDLYKSSLQLKLDKTLPFSSNIFFSIQFTNIAPILRKECPTEAFTTDLPHFTGKISFMGYKSDKVQAMIIRPLGNFHTIPIPQPSPTRTISALQDNNALIQQQQDTPLTITTFNLKSTSQAVIYPDIDIASISSTGRTTNTMRINAYIDEVVDDFLPFSLEAPVTISFTGLWRTEKSLLSNSLCSMHGIEAIMLPVEIDQSGGNTYLVTPIRPAFYQKPDTVFQAGFQLTCDFSINPNLGQNYLKLQHLFKTDQIGFSVMIRQKSCQGGLVSCYRLLPYKLQLPYPLPEPPAQLSTPNNNGNAHQSDEPTPSESTHLNYRIRPLLTSDMDDALSTTLEPLDFNFKTSSFSFVRNITATIFIPRNVPYTTSYGMFDKKTSSSLQSQASQTQSTLSRTTANEAREQQLNELRQSMLFSQNIPPNTQNYQKRQSVEYFSQSALDMANNEQTKLSQYQTPNFSQSQSLYPNAHHQYITANAYDDFLDPVPTTKIKQFYTPIEKLLDPAQILSSISSHQSASQSSFRSTEPSYNDPLFDIQDVHDDDDDSPSGMVSKRVYRSFASNSVQYPGYILSGGYSTFTSPAAAGLQLLITTPETEFVRYAQYWVSCKTFMKIGQPILQGIFDLLEMEKSVINNVPVLNYVLEPDWSKEKGLSTLFASQESCSLRVSIVFESETPHDKLKLPIPSIMFRTQQEYALKKVNEDGFHFNRTISMMYQPDYSRTLESSLLERNGYQSTPLPYPATNLTFSIARLPLVRQAIAYDAFSVALRVNTGAFKGNATHFNWELIGADFAFYSTFQQNGMILMSCAYLPWGGDMIDEMYGMVLSPTTLVFSKGILNLTADVDLYCGFVLKTLRVTQADNRLVMQVTAYSDRDEVSSFTGYAMGPGVETYSRKLYNEPFWTFSTVVGILFGSVGFGVAIYIIIFFINGRKQRKRVLEDRKHSLIALKQRLEEELAAKEVDAYWEDETIIPTPITKRSNNNGNSNSNGGQVQTLFHIPTEQL